MKKSFAFIVFLYLSVAPVIAEKAILEMPLKKVYHSYGIGSSEFYQTGKLTSSFSMICNMGQALPDPNGKEKWYINKPIDGLKLELRARAATKNNSNEYKPMGFVVITKNNKVLKTFSPLGEYENNRWEGDVFNSWSGTDTDIEVFSQRYGSHGYAHFDLLSGNGFFYKTKFKNKPDYFLSECRRIKKKGLPVYEWKFHDLL